MTVSCSACGTAPGGPALRSSKNTCQSTGESRWESEVSFQSAVTCQILVNGREWGAGQQLQWEVSSTGMGGPMVGVGVVASARGGVGRAVVTWG